MSTQDTTAFIQSLQYRTTCDSIFEKYKTSRQHSYSAINRLHNELTQHCDNTFSKLWEHAGLSEQCSLLATGGYGRASLFPHSDLDILVLLPINADEALQEQVTAFLNLCWDANIHLAPAIRRVDECAKEAQKDITIQTTLLEARYLCGSRALADELHEQLRASLDVPAFVEAKLEEMRKRHLRYDDTAYALEPNCKESPGGLRDLHTILWLARARNLGTSWKELHENGVITEHEYLQLRRHWAKLAWIRTRLHWLTGRDENRLLFAHQTDLAHSFGYTSSVGETPLQSRKASEVLMRRYYWSAKAVEQLRDIVLMSMYERIRKLGATDTQGFEVLEGGFIRRDNMLDLSDPQLYKKRPQAILETFHLFQTHPKIQQLATQTLRALFNARPLMGSAFRTDHANRATFMRILQAPSGQTHTFRLLNQHSVLGRYLWAFRKVVGQMQHDLFHVYTVDQHTLMVLRNMRRFFVPKHNDEHPRCAELAQQWPDPWVLYTACLYHDIGKGRGGDHSTIGAAEVVQFCKDHNVSEADTGLLHFLVDSHLKMSQTAQKQDISDPDVIHEFADLVGSVRRLTALYLLTVADVRGSNPKAWNSWKAKLFESLYNSTLRALRGRLGDAEAEIERKKQLVQKRLAAMTLPAKVEEHLWKDVDSHYFLRHDSSDIAWHTRHLSKAIHDGLNDTAIVRCRLPELPSTEEPESHADESITTNLETVELPPQTMQIMVYTPDTEDCFAHICAFLHEVDCNILDAKIYTTGNGYALDTFQVMHTDDSVHAREIMGMIEQSLPRYLATATELPTEKHARLSSRARVFPASTHIKIEPDEHHPEEWALTIECTDRIGLLFNIARVLTQHHVSVRAAKILTLGERVEDAFQIKGGCLQQAECREALESQLRETIEQAH